MEEESAEAHSPPDMLRYICFIQQVYYSPRLLSSVLIFVLANAVSLVAFSGFAIYIIDNQGAIEDFYDVEDTKIGEGSFGRVCRSASQ